MTSKKKKKEENGKEKSCVCANDMKNAYFFSLFYDSRLKYGQKISLRVSDLMTEWKGW